MRAVALVAHPDDCVIFAWPFIEAHPEFKWTIIYLTYTFSDPRAREISAYWSKRSISVGFLGMTDDWQYVKNEELGFDPQIAEKDIINSASKYDLILTHFEDGEYGHIHHKFVNTVARQIDKPKVYFANNFNYNTEYTVVEPAATEELPLHKEVVEGFLDRNRGRYIVTPEAELILKEKQ
jgi:LmbE family N-acetylglucosaminyl deacetylase